MTVALSVGCLGLGNDTEPGVDAASQGDEGTPAPSLDAPRFENGTLHVDVEVPVVLVGFPRETTERLDERLDPLTIHQAPLKGAGLEDVREDPNLETVRFGTRLEAPIVPTAKYTLHHASEDVERQLDATVANRSASSTGNRIEAFLAQALPETGVDVDANRGLLVVLNGAKLETAPDTWTYRFPNGTREGLAVFGEHEPLLVTDTHTLGIDTCTPRGLERLETLVHNATRYRLLQGNQFGLPTATCHAVTLLTAYRPSLRDPTGAGTSEGLYNASRIGAAFENLTSEPVYVDHVIRRLPDEAPAIAAFSRGERYTEEALREWLVENWRNYWVPHEGCTGYLSVLVHTRDTVCVRPYPESTKPPLLHEYQCPRTGFSYQHRDGHRIALSWLNDVVLQDSGIEPRRAFEYLHTHESGHLFGLRHPHSVYDAEEQELEYNRTFSSIWSTMSYRTGLDVPTGFSALDQANLARNTAGATVQAARDQGFEDTPAFQRALAHVARYEWSQATDELVPLLEPSGSTVPGPTPAPGIDADSAS